MTVLSVYRKVSTQHTVFVVVVSHIQRIGCQPEKLLYTYTVTNPVRGLLNRENKRKEKVWQHTHTHTLPPPTLLIRRKNKLKPRDASTCGTQVSVRLASVQRLLRLVD